MRVVRLIFVLLVILAATGVAGYGIGPLWLFALCLVPIGIMVSGYFVMSPKRVRFSMGLPSIHHLSVEQAKDLRSRTRFLGRSLPLGETRSVNFRVVTRNTHRVWSAIGSGLIVSYFYSKLYRPREDLGQLLFAEVCSCLVLLGVVLPSLQWFRERHLLNDAAFVFAREYGAKRSLRSPVRYAFVDHEGNYRGGQCREFASNWQRGEVALVFYDRKKPDRNRANFGFFFHELRWEMPAAQAQTSP